jgi:threonine/homoserine/homoserine lactone efflux protein
MPIDLLLVFFATAILLALTPGPDNLFVLTQSLAFGHRAGVLVTLGLCTGLIFHTSLVAFGLAAIMAASENLLVVIKVIGVVYLLYLAYKSWQDSGGGVQKKPMRQLSQWALYRRGVIMNATNPKVALFFLAFLPQFVDVKYGSVALQVIALGVLFMLATILVFGGIALLAGRYSERLNQSPQRRLILHRAVSMVFVFLALNLLWNVF